MSLTNAEMIELMVANDGRKWEINSRPLEAHMAINATHMVGSYATAELFVDPLNWSFELYVLGHDMRWEKKVDERQDEFGLIGDKLNSKVIISRNPSLEHQTMDINVVNCNKHEATDINGHPL